MNIRPSQVRSKPRKELEVSIDQTLIPRDNRNPYNEHALYKLYNLVTFCANTKDISDVTCYQYANQRTIGW